MNYRKAVFKMHNLLIISGMNENSNLSKEDLKKAESLQNKLLSLGYTLAPKDLLKVAANNECEEVFEKVCSYLEDDSIKDLNQSLETPYEHGIKTLETICEKEEFRIPFKRIISKKERLDLLEIEILQSSVANLQSTDYVGLKIPVKENLFFLFYEVFKKKNQLDSLTTLYNLCKDTGVVMMCIDYVLTRNHYRIKTSEKKLLVRLLESYSVSDLRENLASSNKQAKRCKILLNFLSYNSFSKSVEHRMAVKDLRNSNLRSWRSYLAEGIKNQDWETVLNLLDEHPEILLKKFLWFTSIGIAKEKLTNVLLKNIHELSAIAIVKVLTKLGRLQKKENLCEAYVILEQILSTKLQTLDTPLKGKKVFLDFERVDLNYSEFVFDEDTSCMCRFAYKIPESVDKIRAFVYWDDKEVVDVDLHSSGISCNGEIIHFGCNDVNPEGGIATSGDLTVGNSVEYVDVNLKSDMRVIKLLVNVYSGKSSFRNLDTCYCGVQSIDCLGESVKLYDKKNCFFYHNLDDDCKIIYYGFIDVKKRIFVSKGKTEISCLHCSQSDFIVSRFNIQRFLDLLLVAQNTISVKHQNEADVILSPEFFSENKISFIKQ